MVIWLFMTVVTARWSVWNQAAKSFNLDLAAKDYEIGRYRQVVDHDSFTEPKYFSQKFLMKSTYWKKGNPIFFYCGNEVSIRINLRDQLRCFMKTATSLTTI